MYDDEGRDSRRRSRRSQRSRPDRRGEEADAEEWDDAEEAEDEPEEDYVEEEPRPRAQRTRPKARAARPARRESFMERLGFGGSRTHRRGIDWSDVDEVEDDYERDDHDAEPEEETRPRRPQRRSRRAAEARRRLTLMELCMPVFGYAAMLPRSSAEAPPDYDTFRKEVLAAIQRIEQEAQEHGVEGEDAREASYALCLFLDEQVADSEWQGKERWASEPLHIVIHKDAEGGENFFHRLDELSNRQREVKEAFLVCLSLGYRGRYANFDPAQQASAIGEIRQRILREIHPVPLEKQPVLFPEAYRAAAPVAEAVPPAPRWWTLASGGTVIVCIFLWIILFWIASWLPRAASEKLRQYDQRGAPAAAPSAGLPAASQEGQP